MPWARAEDGLQEAVAIYNFNGSSIPSGLSFRIGDRLVIEGSCGGWYCGWIQQKEETKGIFPISYVSPLGHLKRYSSKESSSEDPLVKELTSSLCLWWHLCKKLYTDREITRLNQTLQSAKELMAWRVQLLSGKLPKDAVASLKAKMARRIDVINSRMSLDMVIREPTGSPIKPENWTAIKIFKEHEAVDDRIKADLKTGPHGSPANNPSAPVSRCHCLATGIQSFWCRIPAEFELSFYLCDYNSQTSPKIFTESFTVVWNNLMSKTLGRKSSGHISAQWKQDESVKRSASLSNAADVTSIHKFLFSDLSLKDVERNSAYLVCRVSRLEYVESSEGKRNLSIPAVKEAFSVGALDLTDIFRMNGATDQSERFAFIPLQPCIEECPDVILRKIFGGTGRATAAKEFFPSTDGPLLKMETKSESGVRVSLQLLHGAVKELRQMRPHLFSTPLTVLQKMSFPEEISPEDVRNDLFVTIRAAELNNCRKISDKNIECRMSIVQSSADDMDESQRSNTLPRGMILPSIVINGPETTRLAHYASNVYHDKSKPEWYETIKVAVPVESFVKCHLRFTFRHRSANENKDKNARPFALAFLRLAQSDGMILKDEEHSLLVYKLEDRKLDDDDISYLCLPSNVVEHPISSKSSVKSHTFNNFVLSPKDSFQVSTVTCSTKLTQNAQLLGLLKWKNQLSNLKGSLISLMKPSGEQTGEEVVKFLPDVLDALFDILFHKSEYDTLVFDCLVYVIGLVGERRYSGFKRVMEKYIQEDFSASSAYSKLIQTLKSYVDNALANPQTLYISLKSLELLMKFITQSRSLNIQLKGLPVANDNFKDQLHQLFDSICRLMSQTNDSVLLCQGAALKYVPYVISDTIRCFDPKTLTSLLIRMITNVPKGKVVQGKLQFILDLVKSDLFRRPDCRSLLLPTALDHLRVQLEEMELLDQTANTLAEMLELLFASASQCRTQPEDLETIVFLILRPIIQAVIHCIESNHSAAAKLTSLMLTILARMGSEQYGRYVASFEEQQDLSDFLLELIMLIRDLVDPRTKPVFEADWMQMILVQNSVLLKCLKFIATTLVDGTLISEFDPLIWKEYFLTAVSFCTQPHIQLEEFSPVKRLTFLSRYKDMRMECTLEVRRLWFHLSYIDKLNFLPGLIGPFLRLSLIPQRDLRDICFQIFSDFVTTEQNALYPNSRRGSGNIQLTPGWSLVSTAFQNEFIVQLDNLLDSGKGDWAYMEQFHRSMEERSLADPLKREILQLINTFTILMKKLLEYREIRERFNNVENQMSCTVHLLDFYKEIGERDLYLKYLHKLFEFHYNTENFVEAACTLGLLSDTLSWSETPVAQMGRWLADNSRRYYGDCKTEAQLKEKIYHTVIELFGKGKLYEKAITVSKELQQYYEAVSFEYEKLGNLLDKVSKFYQSIIKEDRAESEYFRVGFYGLDFPSFLQNKVYIYRGQPYERHCEFCTRMENQFPSAKLLNSLEPPNESIRNSREQFIQINKVDPVFESQKRLPKKTQKRILWYHKHNDVQKFKFSRHIKRPVSVETSKEENEFKNIWLERTFSVTSYRLPGILRWFPVTSSGSYEVSPLQNAIESLEETQETLEGLIEDAVATNTSMAVKSLQLKLKGVLDPAVMGGIANYEKAFLNEQFVSVATADDLARVQKLKDLIAEQIPLLEWGLLVHADRVSDAEVQLHDHMLSCFNRMKIDVEAKYGQKPSRLPPMLRVMLRKLGGVKRQQKHESSENVAEKRSSVGLQSHGNSSTSNFGTIAFRNPMMGLGLAMQKPVSAAVTFKRKSNTTGTSLDLDSSTASTIGMGKRTSNLSLESQLSSDSPHNGRIELTQKITPKRPLRPTTVELRQRRGSPSNSARNDSTISEDLLPNSLSSVGGYDRHVNLSMTDSYEEPPELPPRKVVRQPPALSPSIADGDTLARPKTPGFLTKVRDKPLPPLPTPKDQNGTSEPSSSSL